MTTGTFRYIDPTTLTPTSPPWAKVDAEATSYRLTNRHRPVSNIRTSPPGTFTTDTSGFSLHHAPATEQSFTDDTAIRTGYYAEVETLLRATLPGIARVVFFDHTIRHNDTAAPRQPVRNVHVDQTPAAAAARVRRHLPVEEAEARLRGGRFQIVNVWRPIGGPATDFPLGVVDWRSTRPGDLVRVELLYPKRGAGKDDDGDDRGKEVLPDPAALASAEGYEVKGETYAIAPNEEHRFYYVKDMTPDEAMFIKCFDSWGQGQPGGKEGIAALTPHAAFIDPETPPGTPGRQSIEVRCLVFYET